MKTAYVIRPSSAARRMNCPGSLYMEMQHPQEPTPQSLEGDAAHWLAYHEMKNPGFIKNIEPEKADNGELITQEMIEGAYLYAADILETCKLHNVLHTDLWLEELISIEHIHPNFKGTPDCWLYAPGHLYIWDYKFGHRSIEVFENWQLIAYAAGILNILKNHKEYNESIQVIFRIIQPRGYHMGGTIREWRVIASQLRPYFNLLEQSEHKATRPDAPCIPNPECRFCSANFACKALRDSACSIVDSVSANISSELPPENLGAILKQLQHSAELLDAIINGLSQQALYLIKKGVRIPHFTAEPTQGREIWAKPISEVLKLGELMGFNLKKPDEAITPKQAIKLGVPAKLVKNYSESTPGALKLVKENLKNSRKIFSK